MRFILKSAVAASLAALLLATSAEAQTEEAMVSGSNVITSEFFGNSVAISGDRAIAGAVYHEGVGFNSGSAYIFEKVNGVWTQVSELLASDEAEDDRYGWKVAIDRNIAVVSARYNADSGYGTGSAYVYERINGVWTETAKLTAHEKKGNDFFGNGANVSGNTVAIGASGYDGASFDGGGVFIFEKIEGSWQQRGILTTEFSASGDNLGSRIEIDEDDGIILATARGKDVGATTQVGGVVVFEKLEGIWTETATLVPSDGGSNDVFGSSSSYSNGRIAVGSGLHDNPVTDGGAVYIFERVGGVWTQTVKLTPENGNPLDYFGGTVAVDGDNLLVGSWGADLGGINKGQVYKYQRLGSDWILTSTMESNIQSPAAQFGYTLDLSSDTAIVSAVGEPNGGVAFLYRDLQRTPLFGTLCAGSGGFAPTLTMSGSPAAGGSGSIDLRRGPGGSLAFLLIGLSKANNPLPNGCLQVINPETTYFRLKLSPGGDGDGGRSLPVTVPTNLGSVSIYFQAFVLDAGVPFGYTLTNGLELNLP